MTTWWALCRREWHEHRFALGWAPAGLLALFVLAMLMSIFHAERFSQSMNATAFRMLLLSLAHLFTWLYYGAAVLVLLGSILTERQDRTILFWKSMPTTDTQTVLSKLFVVCAVGPLISLVAILSVQLIAVVFASLFVADVLAVKGSSVWTEAQVGSNAINWIAGYFSQIFWLAPLWGWLLLVSAVARGLTLFWAAAVPAALAALESLVFDSSNLGSSILNHLEWQALPNWVTHFDTGVAQAFEGEPYLAQLMQLWGSSSMWLGILTGCLFLAGTIFFRNRNNEL